MRCKHCKYPAHWPFLDGVRGVTVMLLRCRGCGEFKPLGPARDDGEHAAQVAVEVRGTALADNWREQSYRPGCDRFEWCPQNKSDDLCDLCQAHVLAHAIATHEEPDHE